MRSAQRQNVSIDSGCERTLRTGGGRYKGHGEVRERGQIGARWTDGRQEDERGKKSERERGGEGTRDWVWQRCERTGHAHIRRGHDSTCRLSPAGSTLCTAMLFWLGAHFSCTHTNRHAHTHTFTFTDKPIQLPQLAPSFSLSLSHI